MSFTITDGVLAESQVEARPLGWSRPVPLGRLPAGPGLPLALLPAWLSEWAAAVAESVQVPADLPALVGLTVAAAGVARKVRVQVRSDWAEPTNLYSAVLLRTGERKSKVFELALAPLRQLTGKLRRQTKEQSVTARFSPLSDGSAIAVFILPLSG